MVACALALSARRVSLLSHFCPAFSGRERRDTFIGSLSEETDERGGSDAGVAVAALRATEFVYVGCPFVMTNCSGDDIEGLLGPGTASERYGK